MRSTTSPLTLRQQGGAMVANFHQITTLDQTVGDAIGDQLVELVESHGCRRLVLDFTGVRYIASSVLGRLIGLKKRMEALDGELKLCSLDPEIHRMFNAMGLAGVFDIYSDETKALSAFRGSMIG